MDSLLETKRLRKYFGEVHAVDDVDLTIEEGLITSIIGPNGAGKTSLINLLTGRYYPDSGKVFFKGKDITHLPTHRRIGMGIARSFQLVNIFPKLTVEQNLQIPVLSRRRKTFDLFSRVSRLREVAEEGELVMKDIGLYDKKDLPAAAMSHGDQRLLELGIAVATKPELLFLDEPTSGMNPVERGHILEYVKRVAGEKRTTFVLIEHDMDVVFGLSDRVVILNKGAKIAEGRPEEIRQNENVIEIYLGEEAA